MASKRKISETGPSAIHLSILKYLKSEGLKETVSTFTKEAKLEKANVSEALDLAKLFPETKAADANKKAKVESDSSSSSSDSSSDSDSEDEKPAAKSAPVKMETNDSDSDSSSSSSSDSDSEDEKPAAKAAPAKAAPAKATPAKKAESSDSSSSSSSDSDSSSEDEKPAAKPAAKAAPAKATPAKKAESSDSSSSSSDSSSDSSDDEAPPAKVQKTETPAKPAAKAAAPAAVTPKSAGGSVLKAYVRGLPWAATAEELNDFFKSCGAADSEVIIGDDGRPSGTALVKFSERSELDAALALDGQYWPGTERWLKIVESTEKNESRKTFAAAGERPEGCDTVFLGNLSWDVDEESIRALFGTVGEISSVRFATGEDGAFRGFGHVSFYNAEDTTKALGLAGTDVCGRPIRVDYAPPRNREAKSPGGGRGRGRGDTPGGGRGRGRGGEGRGGFTPKKGLSITPTSSNSKKMTFDE